MILNEIAIEICLNKRRVWPWIDIIYVILLRKTVQNLNNIFGIWSVLNRRSIVIKKFKYVLVIKKNGDVDQALHWHPRIKILLAEVCSTGLTQCTCYA